jgi:hypothetical protein
MLLTSFYYDVSETSYLLILSEESSEQPFISWSIATVSEGWQVVCQSAPLHGKQ